MTDTVGKPVFIIGKSDFGDLFFGNNIEVVMEYMKAKQELQENVKSGAV